MRTEKENVLATTITDILMSDGLDLAAMENASRLNNMSTSHFRQTPMKTVSQRTTAIETQLDD